MDNTRSFYSLTGALLILGATSVFAASPNDGLSLLKSLESGLWQLRPTAGEAPVSHICLGKPEALTQIQHRGLACEQYVVRSSANSVTVSYTCKGQGQGLTTIRKESNRIIHIQSQGIRNNAPFSFSVEGRKAGTC